MRKRLLLLLALLISVGSFAQEKYTLSGTITEAANGETAFGASVYIKGTYIGTITNEYGFYSISAPKGNYTLIVSYVGFQDISTEIVLDKNQKINFDIETSATQLDEVMITVDDSDKLNIRDPQMSVTKIKISTIKKIPVVLGEVDIIKSIQLLPGVTNSGEGTGGFNVRGGAVDQNLVLLDEAIIYNTSHLLGFFSVFNADAIKDIKLYKGGIPAKFGGRVSSVLDVRQKDGNNKAFNLTGGIGSISSRLAAEGPLFKEKGSFLVAGRTSYINLFLKAAGEENSLSFYDLNLKSNYNINENNKLYLSGYLGRDNFNFEGGFSNAYGNVTGNIRWNHIFNDKLFSNLTSIYSEYYYDLTLDLFEFDWKSSINNYNLKYDFKYYASDAFKLDFGLSGIYYDFNPGVIRPTTETSSINYFQLDKKKALETGVYINAEHKLTEKLTAQYGIRYSTFLRLGSQAVANYENNQPVVYNETLGIYEPSTPISETNYAANKKIESFANFEPRVSFSYQLNNSSSVKAGYARTSQYIHLISNTTSVTPLDVWAPSGPYIKPQLSDQYALGYFRNFKNRNYSLEVEAYYKTVANRIDYIDGSDLIGQNNIETQILNGESLSYGLEVLFKKSLGDFTGWIAYTISKSSQRTPGGTAGGPGINNGDWYNTYWDRPHDLSIVGSYQLTDKWSFGTAFIFQTGRPVTYPNGQYVYEELSVANFSERNANRLPSYNRLDISATYVPNKKPENRWKGEWVFGIYNVYNRKNAAAISFGQNRETGANEASRTAIFGIVPSVTYNFKF
jgi:hypothetical protein